MGIKVTVRTGEGVERAMRRLKKTLEREGLRRDLMRHRYHETRTQKRRRQRHKNARKARRTAG